MKQNLAAGEAAPLPAPESSEFARAASTRPGRGTPRKPARPVARAIRITSPESLLSVIPPLLGFQPGNSMVLIGTEAPRSRIRLTLRYDLPDPPDADLAAEIARHATAIFGAQRIETAVAVGYGPGPLVTPVADAIREMAGSTGLRVCELLRVENHRYWSYLCADARCCPPEGTPFEDDESPDALAAGEPRVLGSREELAATVASAEGEQADVMHRATRRAEEHAARLTARVVRSGKPGSARRLIASAGVDAVREAIDCYRRGDQLPAGSSAAWLTLVLRDLRVRDDAWSRMDPEHQEPHLRLWADLTRLARPGYIAAPASLLAFVAWQSGNGALANVALDRALRDDPHYSMARLLRQAIDSGAPPSLARLPMTPEEVAASYDEIEAGEGDDEGSEGDDEGSEGDDEGSEGDAEEEDDAEEMEHERDTTVRGGY